MTAPTTAPPITWTSELSLPVASQERAIRTQELVWSSSIQPPLHSKHPKCNLHQPRLRFQNTFKYRMLVANLSALFLWIAISSCVIAIPTPTVCPSTLMYSLTTFLIVFLYHLNPCVISALFKNGDRVMSPRGLKAVKRAESTESTWHVSSNPSQGSTTGHHQPGGIGR
ncbi:hypothetical protein MJO29_016237 [Puccinia striiformis f. sp. tritici]|nr:hypothetical protein MJO29_016237 [Puccinia striiformis f. sp. tritici]